MDRRQAPESRSVIDVVRPPIWRTFLGRRPDNGFDVMNYSVTSMT
jgi:hypothetical protein